MRYQKNGKVITASEKAYKTIYQPQGYEPVCEGGVDETVDQNVVEENVTDLDEMTVEELKAVAKEKGITGVSALKKEELLALLKDVNAGE